MRATWPDTSRSVTAYRTTGSLRLQAVMGRISNDGSSASMRSTLGKRRCGVRGTDNARDKPWQPALGLPVYSLRARSRGRPGQSIAEQRTGRMVDDTISPSLVSIRMYCMTPPSALSFAKATALAYVHHRMGCAAAQDQTRATRPHVSRTWPEQGICRASVRAVQHHQSTLQYLILQRYSALHDIALEGRLEAAHHTSAPRRLI